MATTFEIVGVAYVPYYVPSGLSALLRDQLLRLRAPRETPVAAFRSASALQLVVVLRRWWERQRRWPSNTSREVMIQRRVPFLADSPRLMPWPPRLPSCDNPFSPFAADATVDTHASNAENVGWRRPTYIWSSFGGGRGLCICVHTLRRVGEY